MTKRWKLKTNSSNILLVLITLILVKAEWVEGGNDDLLKSVNSAESTGGDFKSEETHIFVGNDGIAEYFFHSSVNNNSFILKDITNCLNSFQLITCLKMLLLSSVNDALSFMEQPSVIGKDVHLMNGVLKLRFKNNTSTVDPSKKEDLSLDEEISVKVKRIFQKRSLLIYLLPKLAVEIEPALKDHESGFICFNYTIRREIENNEQYQNEGRKRKKGGGIPMMMMVPQLIMLGLMPFTLASLKAMVMNAIMINMMALNGAIFMTIRNLVFGPRQGDNVKYVNYGYSKDRQTQSKKPVLIIHSPAAFVKQPPVHRKQVHGYHATSYHTVPNSSSESHSSHLGYYHQNGAIIENYDDNYYYYQQEQNHFRRQGQTFQGKNEPGQAGKLNKFNNTKMPFKIPTENNYIYTN